GVTRFITIGTTLESSRRAIALAEKDPRIFAAVGVHPNAAAKSPADVRSELRVLAQHPRVAAIGEAGLDYYRLPGGGTAMEKAAQARLFLQQLEIAADLGLNVVIHQRDAWEDTLA